MSADFWAGYISGAAGIIIGNPLDLIKTRLQAGDTTVHATSVSSLRSTFDQAGTLVRGTKIPISEDVGRDHGARFLMFGIFPA